MSNTRFNGNDEKYDPPNDSFLVYTTIRSTINLNVDVNRLFENGNEHSMLKKNISKLDEYPIFFNRPKMTSSRPLIPYEDIYIIAFILDYLKLEYDESQYTGQKNRFQLINEMAGIFDYSLHKANRDLEIYHILIDMRKSVWSKFDDLAKFAYDCGFNVTGKENDFMEKKYVKLKPYEYVYIICLLLEYVKNEVITQQDKEKIIENANKDTNEDRKKHVINLLTIMFQLTRKPNTNAANKAAANKAAEQSYENENDNPERDTLRKAISNNDARRNAEEVTRELTGEEVTRETTGGYRKRKTHRRKSRKRKTHRRKSRSRR